MTCAVKTRRLTSFDGFHAAIDLPNHANIEALIANDSKTNVCAILHFD